MTQKKIIVNYINILYEANKPLYEYQKESIKNALAKARKDLDDAQLTDKIEALSDKALCEIYKLTPREINPKYCNTPLKDLKENKKTDFAKKYENAKKQLGD